MKASGTSCLAISSSRAGSQKLLLAVHEESDAIRPAPMTLTPMRNDKRNIYSVGFRIIN